MSGHDATTRHVDGRTVVRDLERSADLVVVGSGPAGAAVACEATAQGASVVVVEAGPWVEARDFPLSAFSSMSMLYRDMGSSLLVGGAPIPYLQGKMVGGSSPINGAICWRLPRDVHAEWSAADPALRDALPWDEIETITDAIEARIGVAPTDPAVAGPKNLLMAKGAEALGLEHRPIRRNVRGCTGLGRCMQGCPRGAKQSADATLLADAIERGATVLSSVEVRSVLCRDGRADGVVGVAAGGGRVRVVARHAVVLAASAVQTPVLLLASGLRHGPVGEGFQCHPGVSMAGRFRDPVRMWEGATQGHEVIGLRHEGLKFEVLGFDLTVLAARLEGFGTDFARAIAGMAHWLDWGVAVRAEARGRVRSVRGHTVVTYRPTARDVRLFRRGLRVLGEMMLAAGAEEVAPAVRGVAPRTSSPSLLAELEQSGPQSPAAYTAAVTHMFGTCRMGSDPARSVVRPDFRHHAVASLYVADSSVFPTNVGVNPQVPIMALATLCARRALGGASHGGSRGGVARPLEDTTASWSSAPTAPLVAIAAPERRIELADLLAMDRRALHAIVARGLPLDLDALAGTQYQGIDLSLPPLLNRLLWKTFRKTFHRDPAGGALRGWNVRMEQHGIDGPRIPMRRGDGSSRAFGHYVVRDVELDGLRFPRGVRRGHYLDYAGIGNPAGESVACTPLVAVNAGSMDLLLGWEVLRIGRLFVPLPDYWALRREGPLEEVVPARGGAPGTVRFSP